MKHFDGVEPLVRGVLQDIVQKAIGLGCMQRVAQFFLDNDLKAFRRDMDLLAVKNSAMAVSELRNEFARRGLPICIATRQVPGIFCGKPDTFCEYYFARIEKK